MSRTRRSRLLATGILFCRKGGAESVSTNDVQDQANGLSNNSSLLYGFDSLCTQSFAKDIWTSKASLLAPHKGSVADIFDLADLAYLLLKEDVRLHSVGATASSGRVLAVSPQPERRKGLIEDFFRGATLSLSKLEEHAPRIAAWCRAFTRVFGVTSEVYLYLTPPGSQGLSLHNDRQDLLAAQVWGEKSWKVWDLDGLELSDGLGLRPVRAPFRHSFMASSDAAPLEAMPAPSLDTRLQPGQILYVPRGSMHVASTTGSRHEQLNESLYTSSSSSLHLTFAVMTQSFSYALAIYHLAADPAVRRKLVELGWDLHRFRQAVMKSADHNTEGVAFRQSLPLGWAWLAHSSKNDMLCLPNGGSSSAVADGDAVRNAVVHTLEELLQRVLRKAPEPSRATVEPQSHNERHTRRLQLSNATTQAVADVFVRHLDKFNHELATAATLPRPRGVIALELPADLHVAYIAWGIDEPGGGDLEARFSWCGRGWDGAVEAYWPATILPMLQVVSGTSSRFVRLSDLGDGADPVPKLLFAIELSRLPLEPAIRLLAPGDTPGAHAHRDPECGASGGESEL